MGGIEHESLAVVGAYMASDLEGAINDAHAGIGAQQSQLPADRFRRDGIAVEIEANIVVFCERTVSIRPVENECRAGGSKRDCSSAKASATVRWSPPMPAPLTSDLITPE